MFEIYIHLSDPIYRRFKRFDTKFIRPYLVRDHCGAEPKILETYSKLAMKDALDYIRRNASTIGNISGTESMSAIFRNYSNTGQFNARCAIFFVHHRRLPYTKWKSLIVCISLVYLVQAAVSSNRDGISICKNSSIIHRKKTWRTREFIIYLPRNFVNRTKE